jgi:hypothetical protein
MTPEDYYRAQLNQSGYAQALSQAWQNNYIPPGLGGTSAQTTGMISGAFLSLGDILTGTKHVVVCNGQSIECDSLKEAQSKAEELAASTQRNAYVLKPISVTKPKRETVTEPIE